MLVFASLAAAIVVGIPLGVWAARTPVVAQPVLATVGLIQTVPSLALLAFLMTLAGGILVVLSMHQAARLFVAEGRVVKIEAGGNLSPRERLMKILDWQSGQFEFTGCEVVGADELGIGTSQLLIEHAQAHDEERRSS